MLWLSRPNAARLAQLRQDLSSAPLTYPSDDGQPPRGFVVEDETIELGRGAAVFQAAAAALRAWRMFPAQLVQLDPAQTPLEPGQIVCVLCAVGPIWTVNSCRILRVIDADDGARARFGFTYGTLPGHAARGEETFLLAWDRATEVVSYSIHVFWRPAHWLVWLGYPYLRQFQRRFRRLSGAALRASLSDPRP